MYEVAFGFLNARKKNNVNHFEVVIILIFAIFLSRIIQSPITQKLQERD